MKKANMKSRTELTASELYALERAARLARSREMGRLIRAGANALVRGLDALVRALVQFARRAGSAPDNRKGISHA